MPLLANLLNYFEDSSMDWAAYIENNEIMTYEINNFVLDLAGIDRQLTADGPTNYRTVLNRLDQESVPVIAFLATTTERHQKCEELVKLLATCFYSNPNHYATVEFLTLMAKSRLHVLKNAVGYIATIVLETLSPNLGSLLEEAHNARSPSNDIDHYLCVFGQLVEALISFVEKSSLGGVIFLVPRLTRMLEVNPHLLVVDRLLTGLYTELFRTNHPKTTRQLLNSLTKLVIDGQLEEQWKSVLFEYLTDLLANELEEFLWSPLGDVVKSAFNLLVEMQREHGTESIMTENSTVRTYRKLFDPDFEIKTMAFTFMQTTTTGSIVVKFVKFLLATNMVTDADIAKAYDFVWCFEELRNLVKMQQILTSEDLPDCETVLLTKIIVHVFGKSFVIDREHRIGNADESVDADLSRFISGFPALLWEMEDDELIFTELFKVLDICDAQWFEQPSEEGGVAVIDQILTIISDATGKTYFQMFMTYRLLHNIAAKSHNLSMRISVFLREVLAVFLNAFRFDETALVDKTMGSTIVYTNLRFILVHMSAIYEWFPFHSLIPDGVLDTFHQVVAADLTLNRLSTSDTVEKGCLISILTRLYWHLYTQNVRTGNLKAAKTCTKNIISFVRWLRIEFFDRADCDAYLAMQVHAATCEILTIFSTATTARFAQSIPKLCEKVGKVLDAEFIDALAAFVARIVFNENISDIHGFKLRMLGHWVEFQRVYSDFRDFCASAKILERLVDAGLYKHKIEKLVQILMIKDHSLACKALAFTVSGLPVADVRVEWIEAFSQELVKLLSSLQGDSNLVSHTVKMILKYVLHDLDLVDPETTEPIESPFDILNGLHPLAEALNRQDSKFILAKLRASIGGREELPGNAPLPLQMMSSAFVAFEDLLKK